MLIRETMNQISIRLQRIIPERYWSHNLISILIFPIAVIYSQYLYAPCDDAYIFFVYARNFVEGNGLTYNGLVVEGFSSILWVISLSVLGFTKFNIPLIGETLSIITGLFTLFATYTLAKRLKIDGRWALLPPTLLAFTGDFAFYMSSGLEQVLFTGLVSLNIALSYSHNPREILHSIYFPFLMALMILTRPEGALISLLLLSIMAIRNRSIVPALRCGVLLTMILIPVLVIKWMYYGSWLPNTYFVKSKAGLSNLDQGLRYLAISYMRYGGIAIFGVSLTFWGIYKNRRKYIRDLLPFAVIIIAWITYIVLQGGDNMVGGRVIIPILPLVYVSLVKLASETNLRSRPFALSTVWVFVFLSLLFGYVFDPYVTHHANGWRANFVKRQDIGIYLRENFPPDTLVALNPAGIIPYYSHLPTIDMLGLNDIYIAHQGKRDRTLRYGHQAGDGLYVLSREPDVIIFGSGNRNPAGYISDQEIWNSPQFIDNYELKKWPIGSYAYIKK